MTEANVHWQFELNTASRLRREDSRAAQAAVQEALRLTGYRELRCLQVECSDNAVTISGRVPTYYLKQLAQCAVQEVPGIDRVHNEIHVC